MLKSLPYEEYLRQQGHNSPAQVYEKALGLAGISATYVMPDGKNMKEMEWDVMSHPYHRKKYEKSFASENGEQYFLEKGKFPDDLETLRKRFDIDKEGRPAGSVYTKGRKDSTSSREKKWEAVIQYHTALSKHSENPHRFTEEDEAQLTRLNKEYDVYIDAVSQQLVALNPELGIIPLSLLSGEQKHCFVLGVTSGFNPDDIKHFLFKTPSDPSIARLAKQFPIDIEPPFRMSDKTTLKVIEQLYPDQIKKSTLYLRAKKAVYPVQRQSPSAQS